MITDKYRDWVSRLGYPILVCFFLCFYFQSVYSHPGGTGDCAKFQYLGSIGGTPHPTGYPLYMYLTQWVSTIPLSTLAFRTNALSALLSIAALMLLYRLCLQITSKPLFALFLTGFCGLTRNVWLYACMAEVYSLHALLLMGFLYAVWAWTKDSNRAALGLAGLFLTLGLLHHLLFVAVIPAFGYLLAREIRTLARARWFWMGGILLFLLFGIVHVLFCWRTLTLAPYVDYPVADWRAYIDFALGGGQRHYLFADETPSSFLWGMYDFFMGLRREWRIGFFLLSPFAVFASCFKATVYDRFLLVATGCWFLICSQYDIPDIEQYHPHGTFLLCLLFASAAARYSTIRFYRIDGNLLAHATAAALFAHSFLLAKPPSELGAYRKFDPTPYERALENIPKGSIVRPHTHFFEQILRYYNLNREGVWIVGYAVDAATMRDYVDEGKAFASRGQTTAPGRRAFVFYERGNLSDWGNVRVVEELPGGVVLGEMVE